VQCEGEIEPAVLKEVFKTEHERGPTATEGAVKIAALFIEAGILSEAPGVEAGEHDGRTFCEVIDMGFGPGDEALGSPGFVAVDAAGDIDGKGSGGGARGNRENRVAGNAGDFEAIQPRSFGNAVPAFEKESCVVAACRIRDVDS